MEEVTEFKKMIADYFQSEALGTNFIIILGRLKKKDASTKIQKKKNSIIVVSNAGEIFRVDKRYNGYEIKITGSIFDYIPLDENHMISICKALQIPDNGLRQIEEPNGKVTEEKTNEFKMYTGTESIFKKASTSRSRTNSESNQRKIEVGEDITLKCVDCGMKFAFSKNEAEYYRKNGLVTPKRCKDCREKRKNIEKDYYEIGLKKNTSQKNLDTFGMIAEFNGPAQNEGYTSLY